MIETRGSVGSKSEEAALHGEPDEFAPDDRASAVFEVEHLLIDLHGVGDGREGIEIINAEASAKKVAHLLRSVPRRQLRPTIHALICSKVNFAPASTVSSRTIAHGKHSRRKSSTAAFGKAGLGFHLVIVPRCEVPKTICK